MIIPDAGIGAIVAALITAALTFLGLVVSKEQKISEFRQAWIDAVRDDVADLMASIHAIHALEQMEVDPQANWITLRTDFIAANAAIFRLNLRLNPDEDRPSEIIALISQMEAVVNGPVTADAGQQLVAMESKLVKTAAIMLKGEWQRVKKGEPVFVAVKLAALILLISFAATLFTQLI